MRDKKIKLLKDYFKKEKSVILAFLFGSRARGFQMKESDLDAAVYLKGGGNFRDKERKIWFDLTRLIGEEIDLVCLNDAPASLISNVCKTGIPLKIGDKRLYWELYLTKSSEAEDFLEFVEDFWRIKKKAKSLDKEERERLRVRFDYLNDEMGKLDRFEKLSWEDYLNNWEERKIIERWTEGVINATIDIAKIILASEKRRMPKTYGDALYSFGARLGLSEKEAEELGAFADLRNILAHEYLEVLYARIQEFLKKFPGFYQKIYGFLESYLKENQ